MTHAEVARDEVIERYLRGELSASDREAFEEHFFSCEPCFQELQQQEQLQAAVHAGVREGWLAPQRRPAPPAWNWLLAAASVASVAAAAWLTFYRVPQLTGELSALRTERDALRSQTEGAPGLQAGGRSDGAPGLQARGQPDGALGLQARGTIDPNIPLVMLHAQRDATSVPSVTVPRDARQIVLWIEAPAARGAARLDVMTRTGAPVLQASGLERNAQGAYVVGMPAVQLPPGAYRLRLYGSPDGAAPLIGEYLLEINAGQ